MKTTMIGKGDHDDDENEENLREREETRKKKNRRFLTILHGKFKGSAASFFCLKISQKR